MKVWANGGSVYIVTSTCIFRRRAYQWLKNQPLHFTANLIELKWSTLLEPNILSPWILQPNPDHTQHSIAPHHTLERQGKYQGNLVRLQEQNKNVISYIPKYKASAEITYKNIATARPCWNELTKPYWLANGQPGGTATSERQPRLTGSCCLSGSWYPQYTVFKVVRDFRVRVKARWREESQRIEWRCEWLGRTKEAGSGGKHAGCVAADRYRGLRHRIKL